MKQILDTDLAKFIYMARYGNRKYMGEKYRILTLKNISIYTKRSISYISNICKLYKLEAQRYKYFNIKNKQNQIRLQKINHGQDTNYMSIIYNGFLTKLI